VPTLRPSPSSSLPQQRKVSWSTPVPPSGDHQQLMTTQDAQKTSSPGPSAVILQPRQLLTNEQLIRLFRTHPSPSSADLQLIMDVKVETPDGAHRFLRALIDTGAQTNCIRMNALPSRYYATASQPISITTVSGEPLQGGRREAALKLHFRSSARRGSCLGSWTVDAKMYDSACSVDIILGYPWLRSNRLGILPHRNSLVTEDVDGMRYLQGWDTPESAPSPDTITSDVDEDTEDPIAVMVLRAPKKPPKKGRRRSPPPFTTTFPE
jgi:hypothetical protein